MLIFLSYFIAIALIVFLQRKNVGKGIFKTSKKVTWLVSGVSLLMIYVSVEQGQLLTGILKEKGIWGLWMFWPSLLGALVVPLVIAPLWAKLDFLTDNQFILFRYSGKTAVGLHQFRSIYVGGIVVPFLLSFHILAFSNVLQSYFSIGHGTAIGLAGLLLLLFAFKNALDIKLRTDVFHAVLYLLTLFISIYFLANAAGGWDQSVVRFQQLGESKTNLFPPTNAHSEWGLFAVFVAVQWWSAQLFDGGGPEMARYTATEGKWNVVKAAVLPVVLNLFLSIGLVMMVVMAISLNPANGHEKGFVDTIFRVVPTVFKPIVAIGFFAMFIATSESLVNWGGSFLSVDLYRTYLQPAKSERHYRVLAFSAMFGICVLALLIAWNNTSLKHLILVVFSISAGVAPVYILRWFWLKINAWSQLSAMMASCLFTLLFEILKVMYPSAIQSRYLDAWSTQLVVVTILTMFVWISVTVFSRAPENPAFLVFKKSIPSGKQLALQLITAFAAGIILLVLNVIMVYHLFH
jgi:SSS family solute:Na+ symporter